MLCRAPQAETIVTKHKDAVSILDLQNFAVIDWRHRHVWRENTALISRSGTTRRASNLSVDGCQSLLR
jgi:hypothetical protein